MDVEKGPAGQGLSEQQFDLIIAANVIHATTSLQQSLGHIRQLLAPNGIFMMLEVTAPQLWVDITFGLTDGWWRFSDRELRPDYPLLSRSQWVDLFQSMGFQEPICIPEGLAGDVNIEEAVILARAPLQALEAGGQWLILSDEEGIGQGLADQLGATGQTYKLVYPGTEFQPSGDCWKINPTNPQDFRQLVQNAGPVKGVVHLWSLIEAPGPLELEQAVGLRSTLLLAQALITSRPESPPQLWLVTRGAQVTQAGERIDPNQSPQWGFGKVIAQEHPELGCVRIDLDPSAPVHQSSQALFGELIAPDGENEIALRSGSRYAARLRRSQITTLPTNQPQALAITQRGALDSLVWLAAQRQPPGAGEVEIEVKATGLNFKDVMNVLGMIPGEVMPIGSECAGIVTQVGENVSGLKIGDAVLAITPGCFGTYAIAPAEFTILKPERLNFEQAASVAVPFVTADFALNIIGGMKSGDKVLIHAASGGVGLAAVQLAQRAGAEIFATAGNPEKRSYLESLGVQHVMNSRSLDFADQIMDITDGAGVDLVLNSLAGEFIQKSLGVLARQGRFVELGKNGLLTADQVSALGREIQYFVVDWSDQARSDPDLIRSILQSTITDLSAGNLQPLPTTNICG